MIQTPDLSLGFSSFAPPTDSPSASPPLFVAGVAGLFEDRRRKPRREHADPLLVLEDRISTDRHELDEDDVLAVVAALRGDGYVRGSTVGVFEMAFADATHASHAIAVSGGTAALHLALQVAGIGPGDEVIVPALAPAACASCVRYVGATAVFADVRADTLTLDVSHVASLITRRTRAIIAVDYAGLPPDLGALKTLTAQHALMLIEDAGTAPGAEFEGRRIGSIADCTVFSLLPGQQSSIGQAGMITTNDAAVAERLRALRHFGLRADTAGRETPALGAIARREEEIVALGFDYRASDAQSALGLRQLQRLTDRTAHCQALARRYRAAFAGISALVTQTIPVDRTHGVQHFPIRLEAAEPADARESLCQGLRARGIDASPPGRPIYLHQYWRELGYTSGLCPVAELASEGLLTLPLWHGLSLDLQERVIDAVLAEVAVYA
jgi:perosamine synthetase